MMRIQRSATSQIFRLLIPCLGRKTTTANTLPAPSQSLIQCSRSHGFRTLAQIMAACKVEDRTLIAQINSKLESNPYMGLPCVIRVDWSGVHVHKDGLNQNIEQFFADDWVWEKVSVPNKKLKKLKAYESRDFTLTISFISTKYFESREKFYNLSSKRLLDPEEQTRDLVPIMIVDKISFERILDKFEVTLAFDMEYYLSCQKDVGHKVQELNVDGKSSLNLPESQLFRREIAKIFGEQSVDEDKETTSSVYFNHFRVLCWNGYRIAADAIRGEHYFTFDFEIMKFP